LEQDDDLVTIDINNYHAWFVRKVGKDAEKYFITENPDYFKAFSDDVRGKKKGEELLPFIFQTEE
jgi:hypothetical protein